MSKIRVKICCISSHHEAQVAIDHGASALGLVGPMPSGPGVISNELIHAIARTVPPPVSTFLLTSETKAADIIAHYQKVHTTAIQLVDTLHTDEYAQIRAALPGVKLIQVIHVLHKHSVAAAVTIAPFADALLLDSGNPHLQVKELGGTGRTHNWELSREIRQSVSIPLFLAGGLHAQNVQQAIAMVQPFGVDLCSGVRTGGKLDPVKLKAFFDAVSA